MQKDIMQGYMAGVNLGGWISQCSLEAAHIASFITEEDIRQIATWGMDHVRLPFDHPVLEDGRRGYEVIDKLIDWCKAHGLNVVLDMHHAPGYAFFNEDTKLFTDADTQGRFVAIWKDFAKRYQSEGSNVLFELLNEINDPHGDKWNNVAHMAIDGILSVDPDRYILLGGPFHNAARGLNSLEIWDDEHVLYNFHFYEPFVFTHQRAVWTALKDSGIHQPYPGKVEGLEQLAQLLPEYKEPDSAPAVLDRDVVLAYMAPALEFAKRTGKSLYCGEYGPIDKADMDSRINWLKDVTGILNEHHIGKAYWSYKEMGFSTIDKQNKPVSPALIAAIASK